MNERYAFPKGREAEQATGARASGPRRDLPRAADELPHHARAVDRPVDHLKIGAWLVLTIVLLAGLATGGAWFRPRAVRELSMTRAPVSTAKPRYVYGFWAAMGTSLVLYVVNMFEPV